MVRYTYLMKDTSTIKNWLKSGSINVFGLPFAGKDTQCEAIAELLGGISFGSGAIFREQQDNKELQEIMATGALIPSDMFFDIMLPYFSKSELVGKPLVLSSIGRMKGEETVIFRATEEGGHPTKAVIYLKMPEDIIWKRHNAAKQLGDRGGRADDGGDEILKNRISKFNSQTLPVIEFYRNHGLLVEVDGTKDRENVTHDIVSGLLQKANA